MMCSVEMSCCELAQAFIPFANHRAPFDFGGVRLTSSQVKRINAVMQTCGFYDEAEIIPRYDAFDKAYRRDHVETVIDQGLRLSAQYDVDPNIIYAAAAYHDTGLVEGRDVHHMASGSIIREDTHLKQWFSDEEIETIAQAAEDHRASNREGPRTIYGRILAEADRVIDPHKIIRHTGPYTAPQYIRPHICRRALS